MHIQHLILASTITSWPVMIIELHRKVKNNVGDYYCNPSRYFSFDDLVSDELVGFSDSVKEHSLIVGGGGLIHKKFSKEIQRLIYENPRNSILWGIGHNFGKKHVSKQKGDVYYPSWIRDCSLVGIRDYIDKECYLPCVSCMHPAFDKTYETKNEFVYYLHAFKTKFDKTNNHPLMLNDNMDIDKVIEFLGSGDTIVTDSYHGAYWAQLLNKNVQVVSWSVKFNHMKYPVKFLDNINVDVSFVKNNIDGFLDECRELNQEFYNKTLNLI